MTQTKFKSIRATISDPKLIEAIEETNYRTELTEQEMVKEGLYLLLQDSVK